MSSCFGDFAQLHPPELLLGYNARDAHRHSGAVWCWRSGCWVSRSDPERVNRHDPPQKGACERRSFVNLGHERRAPLAKRWMLPESGHAGCDSAAIWM